MATVPDSSGDQNNGDKLAPVCPSCGSKLTRRSMRRSWQDRFKSIFGLWPYRCQMCNARFTGPQDPDAITKHNADVEADLIKRGEDALDLEEDAADEIAEEWNKKRPKVTSEEPGKE